MCGLFERRGALISSVNTLIITTALSCRPRLISPPGSESRHSNNANCKSFRKTSTKKSKSISTIRNLAARGHWSDYPVGVAVVLERAGYRLRGARLQIRGEVPIGSGLSSSAAIEVATACALAANSGLKIDPRELALLCQRAENEFVGARVGIMDQFISLFGQAQQALLLDCRSLEFRLLPLPDNVRLIICNTMVKHELASSAYNERRAQCEAGVKYLAKFLSECYCAA